jgi:hypothetical protein
LDKLGHELHNAGVIAELPDEHDDLFHLDLALIILSEHIADKTIKKTRK